MEEKNNEHTTKCKDIKYNVQINCYIKVVLKDKKGSRAICDKLVSETQMQKNNNKKKNKKTKTKTKKKKTTKKKQQQQNKKTNRWNGELGNITNDELKTSIRIWNI